MEGPPTLYSFIHSITAEPPVRKGKSGCSLLAWPAWWTALPRRARVLLGLTVTQLVHALGSERQLGILLALLGTVRRWTPRPAAYNRKVAAAPFTDPLEFAHCTL